MKSISLFIALFMSITIYGQEICQNGVDDDGDGLIDLYDPDCACYNASSLPASLITNPSFEQMTSCPNQTGQIELATGWKQATGGTPDYFNCNYKWSAADSVGIQAAQGTGYAGALYTPGWKEYLGTCLSTPLVAGTAYQLVLDIAMFSIDADGKYCGKDVSTYEPVEVTLYGSKHCSALPQPSNWGCPTGGDTQTSSHGDSSWFVLGSALYDPTSDWGKLTLNFTPTIGAGAIMIGAPCTLPPSFQEDMGCSPYMVYDNLVLNTYASFFGKIEAPTAEVAKTVDCDGSHYTLTAQKVEGATQYWIDPKKHEHEGNTFIVDATDSTGLYGTYYILQNCTSEVAYVNPYVDFKPTPENQTVLPNIISPNGDGINDEWNAETLVLHCLPFELSIIDRWGGLVYKQTNGGPAFSGKNQLGANVSDGVYFYTFTYNGTHLKGSLTVVR